MPCGAGAWGYGDRTLVWGVEAIRRYLPLLLLIALLASACRLDVTARIELERDGGADVEIVLVTDTEFEDAYALLGSSFPEFLADRATSVPDLVFEVDQGNGTTTYTGVFSTASADATASALGELVPGLGPISITQLEDNLEFEIDTQPLATIDDVAPLFGQFPPEAFADDVTVVVEVVAPGDVVRSTADAVDGDVYVFELPFSAERAKIISVVSDLGRSFPWPAVIVLAAVAVGLLFIIAVRQETSARQEAGTRQKPVPRTPPETSPPEAPEPAPPADPPEGPPP